jgi:DNA-directed RNA polymerase subunit RPC12/RpoP
MNKVVHWINANRAKQLNYVCHNCNGLNIDFEIMLDRIRIIECHDCGYSSKTFVKIIKMKSIWKE